MKHPDNFLETEAARRRQWERRRLLTDILGIILALAVFVALWFCLWIVTPSEL